MEHIYWRHPTLPGIKVEEVSGEGVPEKVWMEMARQVYCENGREGYREIGHFANGAPFLYGYQGRISISHTKGLLAVATLPATPDVELAAFSTRAALGIDVERADRKVAQVAPRFLSDEEMPLVNDDEELSVLAWTAKEAAYKTAMTPGLDFRNDMRIRKMPRFAPAVTVFDPKEYGLSDGKDSWKELLGEIEVSLPEGKEIFNILSYKSDDYIVTLAYSPKCAKFGR